MAFEWRKPQTLFARSALALTSAFLLFAVVSVGLLQAVLVQPHTKQAADDLAALIVLSAQIWVELPPYTRADYEREMLRRHELKILLAEPNETDQAASHAYLGYLEDALKRHLQRAVAIHSHPAYEGWLWADFPMGGRVMRVGFKEDRLQNRALFILPAIAALGLFAAFVLALLLVRRITRPLALMEQATHRIGKGDFSSPLPETGPVELANLAHKLNLMENQIGELLNNRTTLLAGISHDLRTPLARMRLALELLQNDNDKAIADGLNKDIGEMERLISQTLLLAKGLGSEKPVDTDVCDLLNDIIKENSRPTNDIHKRFTGNCRAPVKAQALKRVVGNLLENAVNYAGTRPVTLTYRRDKDHLTIGVADQGPGIPPAEREAIFQPFHRLETSRSRATGGSGLGLAIVKQLCDANQWRIGLASTEGEGTKFTITVPLPPSNT